jgi:exopolyphosphatase / guanosine-5'-triphosphate,3'-diphosphate pyrophosphatase
MNRPATIVRAKIVHDEIVAYCQRFDPDPAHALHVAHLAVKIFDGLKNAGMLNLAEPYRVLLEYGCILHDIGWVEGQSKHHKRAFSMIEQAHLPLSKEDTRIVALVARFHRKAEPDGQPEFQTLSAQTRDAVSKLAAIIRIADGLDRLHNQQAHIEKVILGEDRVKICISGGFLKSIPKQVRDKKTAYFKKAFSLPAILSEKPA